MVARGVHCQPAGMSSRPISWHISIMSSAIQTAPGVSSRFYHIQTILTLTLKNSLNSRPSTTKPLSTMIRHLYLILADVLDLKRTANALLFASRKAKMFDGGGPATWKTGVESYVPFWGTSGKLFCGCLSYNWLYDTRINLVLQYFNFDLLSPHAGRQAEHRLLFLFIFHSFFSARYLVTDISDVG